MKWNRSGLELIVTQRHEGTEARREGTKGVRTSPAAAQRDKVEDAMPTAFRVGMRATGCVPLGGFALTMLFVGFSSPGRADEIRSASRVRPPDENTKTKNDVPSRSRG